MVFVGGSKKNLQNCSKENSFKLHLVSNMLSPAGDFLLQRYRQLWEIWLGMLKNAQVFKGSSDLLCFCLILYWFFLLWLSVSSGISYCRIFWWPVGPLVKHKAEACDLLPIIRSIIISISLSWRRFLFSLLQCLPPVDKWLYLRMGGSVTF